MAETDAPTSPPPPSSARQPKLQTSVHDAKDPRPPFGARFLTSEAEVFTQNAWDHVAPPDDQDDLIKNSLARQLANPVPDDEKRACNANPGEFWNKFYQANNENFFKNRKWLNLEFPELMAACQPDAGPMTIAEIGCGVGNAVFPLLESNTNPALELLAFDYAPHAVRLVQQHALYGAPPCGALRADVWDLSGADLPPGVKPGSVDCVLLVFVLSALAPAEWAAAVRNLHRMLKPGGLVLLRDYGRHDLTQIRLKAGRLLDPNFYIRGDRTRVYFFELDELALLFTRQRAITAHATVSTSTSTEDDDAAHTPAPEPAHSDLGTPLSLPSPAPGAASAPPAPGEPGSVAAPPLRPAAPGALHPRLRALLPASELTSSPAPAPAPEAEAEDELAPARAAAWQALYGSEVAGGERLMFAAEQIGVDRRMLVNRKRQLKMYRVWMQGKFRKLGDGGEGEGAGLA